MTMVDVAWYQQQMVRMAKRLLPHPNMSEWAAIIKSISSIGVYAFKKVRG
jgi:7,8-dihydro-6-hydroxymethylpterin-pyrophosphokinase